MMRSTSIRVSRFAIALSIVWAVLCVSGSTPGVAHASAPRGQADSTRRPSGLAQGNNRNPGVRPAPGSAGYAPNASRPGGMSTPSRPDAQQHLNEWMNTHHNLSPAQQRSALEAEPGFHQLRPEEQQRMHNLVNRLNSMPLEQRRRIIARTEWMEHLAPQQRQQVRTAMAQLGSLPQDRSYAVGRAFRSLQSMPPQMRQGYLNSPQFQGQFNDQERGTLYNLLNVSPLLPPANLGTVR